MAAPTRDPVVRARGVAAGGVSAGGDRTTRRRVDVWGAGTGRDAVTGGERESVRVAELQRARLLAAAVAAFDELGYVETTVADVTGRARVSRRTFYEQFANGDECLAAVLDDAVAAIERELAAVALAGRSWRERICIGLRAMLAFLDREPALARVCVVQAARGGLLLLERRERALARLAAAVDEGRAERVRSLSPSPLTAEGVVGAALAIVQARLARRDGAPLTDLVNELTAMIVLPFRGPAAARRELERPTPEVHVREPLAPEVNDRPSGDPLAGVRMRLTYRTARVLESVAELGGRGIYPSNRQVAERAGIQDPGQISKLLMRLARLGLLANTGEGHARGEPNAWRLTPLGESVTEQLCLTGLANNACVAPGSVATPDSEEEK
jgi:AcrR family transcriptional regulator